MDNGIWAIVISIISLYVSVISMTKSMRHDLIATACVALLLLFFKPIILWGAEGCFRAAANITAVASLVVTASLCLSLKRVPFGQWPWQYLTGWAAPLLARVIYWVLGFKSSVTVRADIPAYLQLLSAEHKITLDTFQVMITYYPVTLFLAFGIFQATFFGLIIFNLSLAMPSTIKDSDFTLSHSGWTKAIVAILILLPTDWLRTVLVKLISYFF